MRNIFRPGEQSADDAFDESSLGPANLLRLRCRDGGRRLAIHNPAVDASFSHLFNNDVVGNLQGEYQRTWSAVAKRFATNPWILGYDPMKVLEPVALRQRRAWGLV
mgnify:CR=1 FL=1